MFERNVREDDVEEEVVDEQCLAQEQPSTHCLCVTDTEYCLEAGLARAWQGIHRVIDDAAQVLECVTQMHVENPIPIT